jgi:hypothetical protein
VIFDDGFLATSDDAPVDILESQAVRKDREMIDAKRPVDHGGIVRGVSEIGYRGVAPHAQPVRNLGEGKRA